jgi:hypothetical protein
MTTVTAGVAERDSLAIARALAPEGVIAAAAAIAVTRPLHPISVPTNWILIIRLMLSVTKVS